MSFPSVDRAVALPSRARRRWAVRPWLVLAHRWLGLMLAGVLVIAGLTGAILAFDDELDAWLNPALFRATAGAALPVDQLIASVERHDPRVQVGRIGFPTPARGSFLMTVTPRDPISRASAFEKPTSPALAAQ